MPFTKELGPPNVGGMEPTRTETQPTRHLCGIQKLGRADAFIARSNTPQFTAAGIETQRRSKLCCSGANQPASSATGSVLCCARLRRPGERREAPDLGEGVKRPNCEASFFAVWIGC